MQINWCWDQITVMLNTPPHSPDEHSTTADPRVNKTNTSTWRLDVEWRYQTAQIESYTNRANFLATDESSGHAKSDQVLHPISRQQTRIMNQGQGKSAVQTQGHWSSATTNWQPANPTNYQRLLQNKLVNSIRISTMARWMVWIQ